MGAPLATSEEAEQKVGPLAGIPMLGLDALSSAAYGPEAALTVLLGIGALGTFYILPITAVVVGLLVIVFVSYRQTMSAIPTAGDPTPSPRPISARGPDWRRPQP